MLRALVVAAALLGLPACRHAPSAADQAQRSAQVTGELSYLGTGATFDAEHVVGARVNLTRRQDGVWIGTLLDQPVELVVDASSVRGSSLSMAIQQSASSTVVSGQVLGRIVRFELNAEQALVRTPMLSLNLRRNPDGTFGQRGELAVKGAAAEKAPPMPQMALALAATF